MRQRKRAVKRRARVDEISKRRILNALSDAGGRSDNAAIAREFGYVNKPVLSRWRAKLRASGALTDIERAELRLNSASESVAQQSLPGLMPAIQVPQGRILTESDVADIGKSVLDAMVKAGIRKLVVNAITGEIYCESVFETRVTIAVGIAVGE